MKKILLPLLILGLMSFNLFAKAPKNFSEDMSAFNTAKDAKERAFLVFSASWCGFCKDMTKNVWNTEEFQNLAKEKNLKLFYADIDVVDEDLMNKYEVQSVPTWILFKEVSGDLQTHSGKEELKVVLESLNDFFVE